MKEKIYEFPIDQPLTAARRKIIDQHIAKYAHLSPSKVTHEWDAEKPQLNIHTPPVQWEVKFTIGKVEVFGGGPLWARLLFTKAKRAQLQELIGSMLETAGFVGAAEKSAAKTAKPKKGS